MDKLLKEKKVFTLANSRYVLFELPFRASIKYLDEMIALLLEMGLVPIIAHVERYKSVQDNPNIVKRLIEKGCLIQSNFGSIVGVYGGKTKKTLKKLLKSNEVHFLATDCHMPNTIYKMMPNILNKIKKIISKDRLYELTVENPKKILENKMIFIDN